MIDKSVSIDSILSLTEGYRMIWSSCTGVKPSTSQKLRVHPGPTLSRNTFRLYRFQISRISYPNQTKSGSSHHLKISVSSTCSFALCFSHRSQENLLIVSLDGLMDMQCTDQYYHKAFAARVLSLLSSRTSPSPDRL